MQVVTAGRELIDVVKLCHGSKIPLLIQGAHGVGKSQLLEQAAREMNISCIVRDLSLMEPPDLIGLPYQDQGRTKYASPSFLPTEGSGLLVFEELNRCEKYMRAPCLQLLTARALNDYPLPAGWLPVAAINPPEEDYEVDVIDPALSSRFVQVRVAPDVDEWLDWASHNGVHPSVMEYVRNDLSVFNEPCSNPRAWKYVSDVLTEYGGNNGHSMSSVRAAVKGLIGEERAAAFLATLKNTGGGVPITAHMVLSGYHQHRSIVLNWIRDGRLDLIEASLLAVKKHLQMRAHYDVVANDRQCFKRLSFFLHDLPPDLRDQAQEYFAERNYKFPRPPAKSKRRAKS